MWCHLIDNDVCSNPNFQHRIVFRLCAKSFPFAVYYQLKTPSSVEPINEIIQVWSIVEQKNFIDYMQEHRKLEDAERRRKISKTTQCIRRRASREAATEQRRERIRKLSRRKFKWFYDRQVTVDETILQKSSIKNEDEDDNDSEVGGGGRGGNDVDRSKIRPLHYDDSSNEGVRENGGSTELEIITWLRDLDVGCVDDA